MTTGIEAFDATLQETNLWLKDLMERLATDDRKLAYRVLSATLHAVRDRVGPENAVHLAAQLPMLIRGFYFEGWHMAGTPTKERHARDFLARIAAELRRGPQVDVERAVRAVFEVMFLRLDRGETNKLIKMLPPELRDLWPAAATADPAT